MTMKTDDLNESTKTIYREVTTRGIEHILCDLETYCSSQKADYMRQGDYKLAKNWDQLDKEIFNVRKTAMKMQLS